ncbi:MAG: hypothetical protein ACREOO_15650 [bacterium]
MESKIKRAILDGPKQIVKPDIIVHERLSNENCVAIETKATTNPESETKPVKLIALTSDAEFKYILGLFLVFENKKEELLARSSIRCRGLDSTRIIAKATLECSNL